MYSRNSDQSEPSALSSSVKHPKWRRGGLTLRLAASGNSLGERMVLLGDTSYYMYMDWVRRSADPRSWLEHLFLIDAST